MGNHGNHLEQAPVTAKEVSSNSIDFHSVIDLKDYANKSIKIDIDSIVNERQGVGKGAAEVASVNENVKISENGHLRPEHVLNNLILTDNGKHQSLRDNTVVVTSAGAEPRPMGSEKESGAKEAPRAMGAEKESGAKEAPRAMGSDKEAARSEASQSYLPELTIKKH